MHINQTMEREHLQPRFCERGKHQPIYCGQLWTIWHFLQVFCIAKMILIGDFPFGKHSQETKSSSMTIHASKSKKRLIIPAFIDRTILASNLYF